MRTEPGLEILERVHQELGPSRRARISQELRERGLRLVWDQVDRAASMDPVDEALFILDRLYPEMPPPHRASLRRQLEVSYRSGDWHGFERPTAR